MYTVREVSDSAIWSLRRSFAASPALRPYHVLQPTAITNVYKLTMKGNAARYAKDPLLAVLHMLLTDTAIPIELGLALYLDQIERIVSRDRKQKSTDLFSRRAEVVGLGSCR